MRDRRFNTQHGPVRQNTPHLPISLALGRQQQRAAGTGGRTGLEISGARRSDWPLEAYSPKPPRRDARSEPRSSSSSTSAQLLDGVWPDMVAIARQLRGARARAGEQASERRATGEAGRRGSCRRAGLCARDRRRSGACVGGLGVRASTVLSPQLSRGVAASSLLRTRNSRAVVRMDAGAETSKRHSSVTKKSL